MVASIWSSIRKRVPSQDCEAHIGPGAGAGAGVGAGAGAGAGVGACTTNTTVLPISAQTVSMRPQGFGDLTFGITLVQKGNKCHTSNTVFKFVLFMAWVVLAQLVEHQIRNHKSSWFDTDPRQLSIWVARFGSVW